MTGSEAFSEGKFGRLRKFLSRGGKPVVESGGPFARMREVRALFDPKKAVTPEGGCGDQPSRARKGLKLIGEKKSEALSSESDTAQAMEANGDATTKPQSSMQRTKKPKEAKRRKSSW